MKKKQTPRVYWDSSCFIAWLKPEPERRKLCREVIRAAEEGELEIVTSAMAIVEVVKLDKGPLQIPEDRAEKITNFFKNRWIVVVQLSRATAEIARQLVWRHGMKPRDSVHAATALFAQRFGNLSEFHCYDEGLKALDGQLDGLKICEPRAAQAILDFDDASKESEDEVN